MKATRNPSGTLRRGYSRSGSRTYTAWKRMRQRCTNPNQRGWKNYGGRGITVCERWDLFENFLADMGEPAPGMSLDRIDNDGNYEPGNCRWADKVTQNNNRRVTVRLTIDGRTMCIKDWCAETGVAYATAYSRFLTGLPPEEVVAPERRPAPPVPLVPGERNPKTTLTAEQVRWMRRHPEVPAKQVAAMFGISRTSVSLIRSGRRWVHLGDES